MRLGDKALVFRNHRESVTDVKRDMSHLTEEEDIDELKPFVLHPESSFSQRRSRASAFPTTSWAGWTEKAPWDGSA